MGQNYIFYNLSSLSFLIRFRVLWTKDLTILKIHETEHRYSEH